MEVTLGVGEGRYYRHWYEPAGKHRPLTPRISPPPVRGERPEVIPFRTVIHARPLYKHVVGRPHLITPVVTGERARFLRPVESAALAPNTYLFCGEVTMVDCCRLLSQEHGAGERPRVTNAMKWIVDCGVPLNFSVHHAHPFIESELMKAGDYMAGLAWLDDNLFGGYGLHKPVRGAVKDALVLGLDPARDGFGEVRSIPFGTRLPVDPDCVPIPVAFLRVDVQESGPMLFEREPARDPECPPLDLPAPATHPDWAIGKLVIRKLERPIRIGPVRAADGDAPRGA